MKRLIAFAALVPSVALAHPGDHSHAGVTANLRHLLTEPGVGYRLVDTRSPIG